MIPRRDRQGGSILGANSRRLARLVERGDEDTALSESRLHVAFFLFVAGGVMSLAAAAMFVAAQVFPYTLDLSMRFVLRHIGGIVGGIGATSLFVGIVLALATRRYMHWIAGIGAAVTLAAVAGFGWAYPYHWGIGTDYSIPVILTLTGGFTLLVGATFAAAVSNLILRQRVREDLRDELGREPTDEEVARDVEKAIAAYDYTWGGVRAESTKNLNIDQGPVDKLEVHGWKSVDSEDRDTASLDRSLSQLQAFQGGVEQEGELELGGVDQKGAALTRLREEKASKERGRLWNRFKRWLAGVWAWLTRSGGDGEDGDADDE